MKKLLFLTLAIFTLLSCSQQTNKTFIQFEGIEGNFRLLELKDGSMGSKNNETLDTLLKGSIENNKVYSLDIKEPKRVFFYLNDKIYSKFLLTINDSLVLSRKRGGKVFIKESTFKNKMKKIITKNSKIFSNPKKKRELMAEYRKNRKKLSIVKSNKDKKAITKRNIELKNIYTSLFEKDIIEAINIAKKGEKTFLKLNLLEDVVFMNFYQLKGEKGLKIIEDYISVLKDYYKILKYKYIKNTLKHAEYLHAKLLASSKIFEGKPFVDVEGFDLNGKLIKLSNVLKSHKVVLLKFWASWCGPCTANIHHTLELEKKYGKNGFTVFAYSLDSNKEAWEGAIKRHNIPNWVNVSDLKGWKGSEQKKYGVSGIPAEFLIFDHKIQGNNLILEKLEEKIKEGLGL